MERVLRKCLISSIALLWVAGQIYVAFKPVSGMVIRPLHVSLALALAFLSNTVDTKRTQLALVFDMLSVAATTAYMFYVILNADRIVTRLPFVDSLTRGDILFSIILIVLMLEAGRRVLGWSMTIIALIFMAYSFFGSNLPGILAHPEVTLEAFIENQTMTSSGIYSSPVAASADTIFYFMIFGTFLSATPAGKLFVAIAKYATRKSIGGAGKAAIVASGLFGMISGSAAANVASVGVITYPLMERAGFRPVFGAAVLATAGTGGQLIPPVMGASAFIMADMLGVPYFKIILCAILPSILYVASLFWAVHLDAGKRAIPVEKIDKDEQLTTIKNYAHLSLSVVVLVALIAFGRSLMYSSLMATLSLIALCQLRKDTRLSPGQILQMAINGAKSCVIITLPCAISGIVIGEVVYTGLGLRFSALIASLSAGSLPLALLLSTVMIIIMGMGMPTSAAYIMSAVLLAPAMQRLGIEPLVAHMFIFYFANMSMITPPVAIASYTAAGIAKTGLWETGIEAVRIALILFLIPFVFVYNPSLLGLGPPAQILITFCSTAAGATALGIAIIGYWLVNVPPWLRVLFAATAICLIIPETITDIIGVTGLAACLFVQYRKALAVQGKEVLPH